MINSKHICGVFTAIAAGSILAGDVLAHTAGNANQSYLGDSSGHYISDSSGNCIRTGSWKKEEMTVDCGAEPKVETKAPPPAPPPPPEPTYETVTLTAGALFDLNKSNLRPAGMQALDGLADRIQATDQIADVQIIGHTDSSGPDAYNQQLSVERATTVRDYLAAKGVNPALMTVSGRGESQPVADNATAEGRAQNRRVEVNIGVTRKE